MYQVWLSSIWMARSALHLADCRSQDTAAALPSPDPSSLTFICDMGYSLVNNSYTWQVADFPKWRKAAIAGNIDCICSPYLLTSDGYSARLKLAPNGWRSGQGTHLKFLFAIEPGPWDHELVWPFPYSVHIEVLDMSDSKNHVRKTITRGQFKKDDTPPSIQLHRSVHLNEFMPLSWLDCANSQYLKNDALWIRLTIK